VFIAHVEFRFEADNVEAGGRRLRDLSTAARSVGFEMKRGQVEPAPLTPDPNTGGWTEYGPDQD